MKLRRILGTIVLVFGLLVTTVAADDIYFMKAEFDAKEGQKFSETTITPERGDLYSIEMVEVYERDADKTIPFDSVIKANTVYVVTFAFTFKNGYDPGENRPITQINDLPTGYHGSYYNKNNDRVMEFGYHMFIENHNTVKYSIKVEGGRAFMPLITDLISEAVEGDLIYLEADSSAPDNPFDHWEVTEGNVKFEGVGYTSNFFMPAHNVAFKAIYKNDIKGQVEKLENIPIVNLDFKAPIIDEAPSQDIKRYENSYTVTSFEISPVTKKYEPNVEYVLKVKLDSVNGSKFTPSTNYLLNGQMMKVKAVEENHVELEYRYPKLEAVKEPTIKEDVKEEKSNDTLIITVTSIAAVTAIVITIILKKHK